MSDRFVVTYRVWADAASIEARAQAIAVEQSVEMPLDAIADQAILDDIVGQVREIADNGDGSFMVRIALATATVGADAGQLLNMAFGNASLLDDVTLLDIDIPDTLETAFGGPTIGIAGLRARVDAGHRALTCAAIKPQGLPPARLADIAARFAAGGIDYVKDDHGLADQDFSPFVARVASIAEAMRRAGPRTRYVPSLSGHLQTARAQLRAVREAGLDAAMVAPMVMGVATFHALRREAPDIAFFAHPAYAGAARVAPPLLLGKLFRLFGADAVIFPNYGGRFGYSRETCLALAEAARGANPRLKPALPVPAGGMTRARVAEMLEFFGPDTMLLIGGNLLQARERLVEEAAAFARDVAGT